ncbi:swr complex subunit [Paraconiothyrium brasiliense]|uniref:SWR1-complex protein 4 n=1 Tax=Paraconiothyrium brasiliense TaxID=300254 RepID=A0ABR3S6Z6_9PLEO
MASGRDVRDMLGLPIGGDAQKSAVQKRAKAAAPVRRIQGVAREVAALYGERPPPVAVYEEKKAYRAKRQNQGPAKKWVQQPFVNQARHDGLILKHWRRKPTIAPPVQDGDDAPMEDSDNVEPYIENSGDFLKYSIQVDLPTFTDEEYDAYLRSDDWSREETDYLFEVVKDYSYRWAVIWDRYDYQPANKSHLTQETVNGDASQALAALPFAPPKQRTVEDLKARFYHISAKLMKLRIPEMQMDAEQYTLYETLSKFNPELEGNRKLLAAALMNRSMDEVKEEEFLLAELQRINMAANRLDAEREELRARLEHPSANQQVSAGLASFTSSQALQALFSQLFAQDRSKKRASGGATGPSRISLNTNDLIQTPSSANAQLSAAARRQSMATNQSAQTPIRTLSPQQEYRYNVSTHDRLTSGVTFGSDKLLKMRQAKSNVQTQKIAAALAELGVSEVISLPTSKVSEVFEQLIGKVSKLLDVRKVREKEEGESRVLEQMKLRRSSEVQNGDASFSNGTSVEPQAKHEVPDSQEQTPGLDGEGEADDDDNDGDGDEHGDDDGEVDADAEGEEDDEDAEGEEDSRVPSETVSRAASTAHKRSASVLSQGSVQSSKRARK